MKKEETINRKRRNFIKMFVFGGGALVLSKIFGGGVLDMFSGPKKTEAFQNFKVSEKDNKFIISSKGGQELLIMDSGK